MLSLVQPQPTPPVAAFVPCVRSGDLVFVSGHIARRQGKPWRGRLGDTLTTAEGIQAAQQAALIALGTLQAAGDLEHADQIVKLMV
jgi:enamine deaminase RidA (YjgF/YER057c/UK114 family)